ncbi:MAG: heavy-metal-associated domain-containing protein [Terriglobales bacterium]
MSVAVKKLDGVTAARVSLNQGLVTIELRPGNTVSLAQLRKAITDQGFTPRDARVTAAGELVPLPGKHLQFKVSGVADVFQVLPTPHVPPAHRPGAEATVEGLIPAPTKGPATIQITSVKDGKQPT